MDDEYFKIKLSARKDIASNRAIKEILPSVKRAFSLKEKRGLLKSLLRSMQPLEVYTPGGIYLGTEIIYEVDLERLYRVVRRVIYGLYYNHKGERLPNTYIIQVLTESGVNPDANNDFLKMVIFLRGASDSLVINEDVFSYRCKFIESDSPVSWWTLVFFNKIEFIGTIFQGTSTK